MNNYINIHTHHHYKSETVCIINLLANKLVSDQIDNKKFYSIGLHPWHINQESTTMFENNIQSNLIHSNIIAIGETGLDRVIEISFEEQTNIFLKHVLISERQSLPMIIHCVRAYNDLIRIRKDTNAMQPWILHGYRGNPETTLQLLKYDFYFSFGTELTDLSQKLIESIVLIPLYKIFLETDDHGYDISDIYKLFCASQNLEMDSLKLQIANNFKRCFGFDTK